MKKILYSLIAVLAMVMSSCSNDDIEITRYVDNLRLQISTQTFYDDFGITQEIKDSLSQNYKVGIYTFIYGKNGDLVASQKSDTKRFGIESHSFQNLEEGVYTVIVAEMLENVNKVTENAWAFKGEDNLSTIQLIKKKDYTYSKDAVGLYANELYLSSEFNTIDINPRGVGVIINTCMSNFNTSNYKNVAFYTKDEPQGRFLSPNYYGEDRFYYDEFNKNDTWTPRGYVYYEGSLPTQVSLKIYLLEEGSLKYSFGAMKEDENGKLTGNFWGYPSNDETTFKVQDGGVYYGGFLYTNGINITNDCLGDLFATQNEFTKWYVKNNGVKPLLNWGTSTDIVDSYMKENDMIYVAGGLSNNNNNRYFLQYKSATGKLLYEYRFDKDETNLKSILLVYDKACYDKFNILDYLIDMGFSFVGYNSNYKGYFFETQETTAIMYVETDDIRVVFSRHLNVYSQKQNLVADKMVQEN